MNKLDTDWGTQVGKLPDIDTDPSDFAGSGLELTLTAVKKAQVN